VKIKDDIMRLKYVIKNSMFSIIILVINILIGLIRRGVMIKALGPDLVGLSALFGDVIGILNVADIGISGGIGAVLFKPIHERNFKLIGGVLNLYKKMYLILGAIFVFVEGILTIYICYMINHPGISNNDVRLYFFLISANVALTYFLTYRFILIATDQNLYKYNVISVMFKLVSSVIQVILLIYITKSFMIYLLIELISNFLYIITQNWLIKRQYKELDTEEAIIDIETKNKVERSLKGYGYEKIGTVAVFGTNYIYTAVFSGLGGTAIYSNYQLLVNAMVSVSSGIFNSLNSTIGNILATESKERAYKMYRLIFFINFWIASLVGIIFYNSSTAFVTAWAGKDYVASTYTVILFTAYFFFTSIRSSTEGFKAAGGIFYEDRYIPLVEAAINFIACISLGSKYGLPGVIGGNLISTLAIVTWQKPYMVFKLIFERRLLDYFKDFIFYIGIGVGALFLSRFICTILATPMNFIGFIEDAAISFFVVNVVYVILFYKITVFKELIGYYKDIYALIRNK
jgi:hypothetical protein